MAGSVAAAASLGVPRVESAAGPCAVPGMPSPAESGVVPRSR